MSRMFQHLRRVDYISMPWRNGAGSTLEIARDPCSPGEFRWRLSLASISASGPFSSYPGYHRCVTLIEGAGFRLNVEGQPPIQLTRAGASASFDGGAITSCELVSAPSTDLSLMVREPGVIASVAVESCDAAGARAAPPDTLQAFFCLDEGVTFAHDCATVPLARYDTIVMHTDGARCDFSTARAGARLLRLVWKTG
jgi:environmental stress-induced protein Ves